ncbi:MAG: methyltransferase domain-containing protein [Deltaproteobacteria bacterium]|nr:methyltransferase domain-containing protein [Deltaproteobacteria bacterium]
MDKMNGLGDWYSWRRRAAIFFQGFLRHPDLVGSVIPSSRFLERKLVETGEVAKARLVVELGPGTGGTTKAFLKAMPKDGRLLAIEINPDFIEVVRAAADPRLIVHHGSAEHIREILEHYSLPAPDVVLSGIPFSTMPPAVGRRIIQEVWACLAPGGRFVPYQVRGKVADLGQEFLGAPKVRTEVLNIPPVRIFSWRKPSGNGGEG